MSLPRLGAMILAGGRSRRMGRDKALLQTPNGQPLLQQTARIARQLTSEVAIVTPWPERYLLDFSPQVCWVKERSSEASLLASDPSSGPLSGFAEGWPYIQADWCLLLACDLPYLEAAVLSRWWHWLRTEVSEINSQPPIAASLTAGTKRGKAVWEPLCGFYHRGCVPGLNRYLALGGRSFQAWLLEVPIAAYRAAPPDMLFNCNTPADWARVQRDRQADP